MGRDRRSGFASPFDEMLEQTRKEFEKLAGGTGPRRSRERPPEASREREPAGLTAPIPPPNPPAPLPRAPAASAASAPARPRAAAPRPRASGELSPETERFLDERLGNGWSFEVTERRREGDEVVARCKLSLADRNLSKTQYGRARVASAGSADGALEGSADGLAFSIETNGAPLGNGGGGGGGAGEDEAFQQAIESALAKCAELLSKTLGTGGVRS